LVEPPVADTTAQAFSSACRVTMSRGSGASPITAAISCLAARRIKGARSLNTAGTIEEPIGARPSASLTMPMVLAVNWPAQEPAVGRQASLTAARSACVAAPASTLPMVS
jgi:hypothetical protein